MDARRWGSLGDRIGHEKVLIVLLALSALFYIPQALVTSLWQLILFLIRSCTWWHYPLYYRFYSSNCPVSMQGEVLGYNISFRFLGNVAGTVLGGIVASRYGISSVFYVIASLFLLGAFLLWENYQYEEKSVAKAS